MDNIVLCGFMGCGKSTVGRNVARKSGRKFIDMDLYIEKKTNMKISEIFEKYGESGFRDMEHYACLDVPLEIIKMRLKNDKHRPLLQRPDKNKVIKELYQKRLPLYNSAADIVISGKNTPLKTAYAVINAVNSIKK